MLGFLVFSNIIFAQKSKRITETIYYLEGFGKAYYAELSIEKNDTIYVVKKEKNIDSEYNLTLTNVFDEEMTFIVKSYTVDVFVKDKVYKVEIDQIKDSVVDPWKNKPTTVKLFYKNLLYIKKASNIKLDEVYFTDSSGLTKLVKPVSKIEIVHY